MNIRITDEQKLAILQAYEKGPHHPSELTFVPGYTHYDARDRQVIREMCHALQREGLLVPTSEQEGIRTMPRLALSNTGRALLDELRKKTNDPHPGIAEKRKEPETSQGSGSG